MSKKSFVKGAAILAAAGIIAKAIGALFRIPLMNIIHEQGMGLYQLAYPVYAFLLIVSTAGLPTAISKLVSEKIALDDYRGAHKVFRVSFRLLLVLGLTTSIIMLVGSPLFAKLSGNEKSFYPLLAIAPSLFFVSLLSSYRGYFQGMQIMTPTALTQIVEQFGKLIMGLWFAALWIPNGPEYGAAGAVLGVTLSEVAALVLIVGIYRSQEPRIYRRIKRSPRQAYNESSRSIMTRIVKIAIPVTIGASIMPLVNMADAVIVINRLTHTGFTKPEATGLYGILTGGANPLINFPTVFTIALGMSLVPAISESYAVKDWRSISDNASTGIKLTLLIGLPAACGLYVLALPISRLLYSSLKEEAIINTGNLIATLSLGVVFLTLIQTLTAILQGVNRIVMPVKNLMIGALFKVVLSYVLVGIPALNVKGAAIGTVTCYGIAAVLDFAAVISYAKVSLSATDFFIKPLISTGVMALCVYGSYNFSYGFLKSNIKATILSILVGVLVYAVMLLVTGVIKRQDFELLPKGKKVVRVLDRLGLLRK